VARELADLAARDERIRLGGHVGDRDEFLEVLGAAKAYLHGHSVGGMNPSLVEALRAGARVLAFDTPFNREVVDSAGEFFTISTLDHAISELTRLRPDELARRRDAAAARAVEHYAIEPVVDAYEDLLRAASHARARSVVTVATRWDDRAHVKDVASVGRSRRRALG
jgi:glycosyltransferase involved in cell wall biosynthesis